MHRAGNARQITIGNALEVETGKRVCQIAHDHKTVHRTRGHVAEFFLSIDEEHRGFGVVGVDGEVAGDYLIGHGVTPIEQPPFAAKRRRWRLCAGWPTGQTTSGTPEGVPRTAAIKRIQARECLDDDAVAFCLPDRPRSFAEFFREPRL